MYSESSRENASFAADNRRGMQALTIQYAFLSSPQDAQVWTSQQEEIAQATAEGIAKALRIELD